MSHKIWQFRGTESTEIPADCIEASGGSPLLAKLLYNRGIQTAEEIRAFLNLADYTPTSGLELPDMAQGVERVLRAIDQKEPILIFGDFDVDGITGTSVLYQTLTYLGAKVSYYIPDRATEGHGLNVSALCRLVSTRHIKLVITTDTGITNFAEVSLLNGLKVDTIVTDHHELPENLPPALANINPKRLTDPTHPLEYLAGVGVAYLLCEQLLRHHHAPQEYIESLLDLVAIGTVADLATLHRENRYLVYRGVQVMNQRKRLGVNEILTQAGTTPEAVLSSETVGFVIGPRLNALGRLDNATEAVELLTTEDLDRARNIAAHLEHLNRRRQQLCEQTFLEAEKHMMASGGLDGRKVIILASPDWNLGIIGIVASRLIEKYHVPVFLMVIDESKGEARCSARSIPGFHLYEALSPLSHYFIHFGGHSGAGGFSIKMEHLESFKRELYTLTDRMIQPDQMRPLVEVDARLQWSQLNPHLIELLSRMEPFGKDNPSPLFVLEEVRIAAQRFLGSEAKHLKLVLQSQDPKQPLDGLFWNAARHLGANSKLNPSGTFNLVVSPELNTYNNVTKVQLIIQDIVEAGTGKAPQSQPTLEKRPSAESLPVMPVATGGQPLANSETSGLKWIDHRSRESLDSFIGQLMLPLQDSRNVLLYHEGRKPDIPFLSEAIVCMRFNARPADELILWDLPPDRQTLTHLLETVKPSVVHVVGGKYQTVPVFPVVGDYLKLLYRVMSQQAQQAGSATVPVQFSSLASQLASSRLAMLQGLVVLGKLGMVSILPPPEGSPEEGALVQLAKQQSNRAGEPDIAQSLEWLAFQQTLQEIGQFRDWILKAPLETLKTTYQQSSTVVREEVTSHG